MLSKERKAGILASLKADYIPISDVFFEICSDIVADMSFTGDLHSEDKSKILALKQAYIRVMKNKPEKAIPLIEELYELRDKYAQKRKEMGF